MTKQRSFKRRVRERMDKTGESYSAARRQVSAKRDRVQGAHTRLADTSDRPSDESVVAATGRSWDAWFSLLDGWGARERPHKETAAYLVEEHGLPGWWAQSVTVYYERARGLRLKHQKKDGFSVSASKTLGVPVGVLYEAVVDPQARQEWLTDGTMSLRTSQPRRTARFDWGEGPTRVTVWLEEKGPAKTTVTVAHERLPDPDEAERAKAAWRARLVGLTTYLEA